MPNGRQTLCASLVDVPCFAGFATVAGEPLTLYKTPPRATPLPEQSLDGDSLRLNLRERFDAAPGEALTYTAESSDPSVASVRVDGDHLVVEAEGDGVATVTVTATDAYGQTGALTFTVRATLPVRQPARLAPDPDRGIGRRLGHRPASRLPAASSATVHLGPRSAGRINRRVAARRPCAAAATRPAWRAGRRPKPEPRRRRTRPAPMRRMHCRCRQAMRRRRCRPMASRKR